LPIENKFRFAVLDFLFREHWGNKDHLIFRYNDIAKHGFEAIEISDLNSAEALRQGEALASLNMANAERPSGLGGYWSTMSLLQNQKEERNCS